MIDIYNILSKQQLYRPNFRNIFYKYFCGLNVTYTKMINNIIYKYIFSVHNYASHMYNSITININVSILQCITV